MNELANKILAESQAPVVAVADPREGVHPNVKFLGATLDKPSSVGWTAVLSFGGMLDTNGREFEVSQVVTIPTIESPEFIRLIYLNLLHSLEILERGVRKYKVPVTEEDVQINVNALNACIGMNLRLRIGIDRKGFLRADIQRQRRANGE